MAAIVAAGAVAEGRRRRLFKERVVLTGLRDQDILGRYELDRGSIEMLIQPLGEDLTRHTKRSSAIPASTQVCCHLQMVNYFSINVR